MNNKENLEKIERVIAEADMILVGIGEEFFCQEYLQEIPQYKKLCYKIAATGTQWMMPYVNDFFLQGNAKVRKALQNVKALLEGKNFFVISVLMDGLLLQTDIWKDRVVEPCGGFTRMQCSEGCHGVMQASDKKLLAEIELVCKGEKEPADVAAVYMKECGHKAEFNSLYAEHYREEGYQEQWNLYTKWLQGTLNRKLCILELGSGMMFASILRFRFEKIAGLNQKVKLVRVHHNLYQLPEEIAERSIGISENAVDFMAELWDL